MRTVSDVSVGFWALTTGRNSNIDGIITKVEELTSDSVIIKVLGDYDAAYRYVNGAIELTPKDQDDFNPQDAFGFADDVWRQLFQGSFGFDTDNVSIESSDEIPQRVDFILEA